MSDNDPQPSPGAHDDAAGPNASGIPAGNGGVPSSNPNSSGDANRGVKRSRPNQEDDEDDEDNKPGRERRKIEIKFIQDKSRRHITFSKRKAGIMKKAYELSVLTGTQVLLLVVSETGLVYTFTTPKLQPLVTKAEGKNLIQACLNAPEPHPSENGIAEPESAVDSPEEPQHAQLPPQATGRPPVGMPVGPGGVAPGSYMSIPDAQAYQHYIQQQAAAQAQVQARGGYLPQHPAQMQQPQPHPTQTS